jgi:hypothetical protein
VSIDQQLATEITDQLEDDILYFGWMVQIARIQNPDRAESDNIRAVIDCVTELQSQGTIVVGNVRDAGGLLLIDRWPEKGQDLQARMATAIEASAGDDRLFCFWIQLAEHFAR